MPSSLTAVFDALEEHYGRQVAHWPRDPYAFLIWWHCGYPPSDDRCAKGWTALTDATAIDPPALLAAKSAVLAAALKAGGAVPALRAQRLKEIAFQVHHTYGNDLHEALRRAGPEDARTILKGFPSIADPGADRMLLFARIAPIAAVPSNNASVVVRLVRGREWPTYGANYRAAKKAIDEAVPPTFKARMRAYLLLKQHGQVLCTRTAPACEHCPARPLCAYPA